MTLDTSERRRRPWPRRLAVIGGVCAVLALLGLWMVSALRSTATEVEGHASGAQAALRSTQTAITAGDVTAARAGVAVAQSEIAQARSAASSPLLSVAGVIPGLSGAVHDVDLLLSSAELVGQATGQIVDVYASVSGKEPGTKALFANSQIDLAQIDALAVTVREVDATLAQAQSDLESVSASLPGTARLAKARDEALAEVRPTRATLASLDAALAQVPAAVGAEGPRTYLVAILNQAELRASGGTPLSIAVVAFDKGKLSIPLRKSVSRLTWPNGFVVTYQGASGSPWNRADGSRTSSFQNASFPPDFRSAGHDMAASWNKTGYRKVDGVIALDISAISEVLRQTGPITDSPYGELTADNLGQKLLVDAYRDFASDQLARQDANQVVVAAMLDRLTSGSGLLGVVRALGDSAPGRHFQVWMADQKLQSLAHTNGLDGALSDPAADHVAVFSQNDNASKSDVFQQRAITVEADVHADGSASITQRTKVTNATPADLPVTVERVGYTTTWAGATFYLYRPVSATKVSVALPKSWVPLDWAESQAWADDGHGNVMTRVRGDLKARTSAVITISYDLPAGTFGADGKLAYAVHVDPQPIYRDATVTVIARGPSGVENSVTDVITRPLTLTLPVT